MLEFPQSFLDFFKERAEKIKREDELAAKGNVTEEEKPVVVKPPEKAPDPFPLLEETWVADEIEAPVNTIKFAPRTSTFNKELFKSAWQRWFNRTVSSNETVKAEPKSKATSNGVVSLSLGQLMSVPPFMVDTSGAAASSSLGRRLRSIGFDATTAFSITYLMQGEASGDSSAFNYRVIIKSWTPESIDLALEFDEPAMVSLSSTPDIVMVTVKNPYLFVSKDGKLIDTTKLVIVQEIPRQLPNDYNYEDLMS